MANSNDDAPQDRFVATDEEFTVTPPKPPQETIDKEPDDTDSDAPEDDD